MATPAALYTLTAPALAAFQAALAAPQATQTQLLHTILQHNAHSQFGRRHGFAQLSGYADFAAAVPLGNYASHQHAIEQTAHGVPQLLSSEPVLMFEETGGSSGGAKLVPYTAALQAAFARAVLPWLGDLMRRRPQAFAGQLFFIISPASRNASHTPGGIPIGSGNDLAYFGHELAAALAGRTLFLPELLQAQSAAEWQWHSARLLLHAPALSLISVWSPTLLLAIIHTLQQQQDSLLATVTDRHHRARLSRALSGHSPDTRALWSQLDTISCWCSHTAAAPAAQLQALFPQAYLQGKGLLATEGITSLPFGEHPYPLLAVNSHFYEFAADNGEIYQAHELAADAQYRVIITTQGGLYRYDTGDCVQVCGFEQGVPRLNFIGRSGWYSDVCGEKLNEAFVRNAMLSVDPRLPEHCLLQGTAMPQPHYRLLAADADAAWLNADVCAALDSALHANPQYAHARRIGQLHPLRLHWVADIPAHAAALARPEQRLATRKIALLLPPQTA